jgi:hypothetical protein
MGSKQTVIIKNYHNGGGDLKLEVGMSGISEKIVGGVKVIRLKITRQPDKHSTRLGMFAFLRNTQPGYQNIGFSEITLTFDQTSANGKFLSRTFIVFTDVAVEKAERKGDEEEITFLAGKKSEEFAISNVPGTP